METWGRRHSASERKKRGLSLLAKQNKNFFRTFCPKFFCMGKFLKKLLFFRVHFLKLLKYLKKLHLKNFLSFWKSCNQIVTQIFFFFLNVHFEVQGEGTLQAKCSEEIWSLANQTLWNKCGQETKMHQKLCVLLWRENVWSLNFLHAFSIAAERTTLTISTLNK